MPGISLAEANVRCVERDAENVKYTHEKGVPPLTSFMQQSMMHSSSQKRCPNGLQSNRIKGSKISFSRGSAAGLETNADLAPDISRPHRAKGSSICTILRHEQHIAIKASDRSDHRKANRDSSKTCCSSEASYVTANTSPSLNETSNHLRPTASQISPTGLRWPGYDSEWRLSTTQSPTPLPPPPPPSIVSERSISSWLRHSPHKLHFASPRSHKLRIWIPQTSSPTLVPQRKLVFLKNQATAPVLAPVQNLDLPSTPSSNSARKSKTASAGSGGGRRDAMGRAQMRRIGTLSSTFRPSSLRSFRAEKAFLPSDSQF
nr:hypothetical protein CFP56_03141 [Quercus suber]